MVILGTIWCMCSCPLSLGGPRAKAGAVKVVATGSQILCYEEINFFRCFYISVRHLDNEQGELDILIDEHAFDIISITKNPVGRFA